MTAAAATNRNQNAKPDPLVVFLARCETRAQLVAHGLHNLQDSVDTLQAAAEAQGLVARYGQGEIQQILSESFGRWRLSDGSCHQLHAGPWTAAQNFLRRCRRSRKSRAGKSDGRVAALADEAGAAYRYRPR
jgi:hypothetical protein